MTIIPRRVVLTGLATAPLIAQFARVDRTASAQAGIETVSVKTPSGRTISGFLAVPTNVPAPAVLLFHGGLGVLDFYKSFASDFARDGFFALALDLYDGRIAKDDATNLALSYEVNSDRAKTTETISAWIEWLKADPRTNGKVGVVGWSFGAGWALEASMTTPVEATVVYVGLRFPAATRLARLKGPLMAHLAEQDNEVTKSNSVTFENIMADAGKSVEVHWYPGDHYFPFPPRPSYDKDQADLAWTRTVQFFRANLQ